MFDIHKMCTLLHRSKLFLFLSVFLCFFCTVRICLMKVSDFCNSSQQLYENMSFVVECFMEFELISPGDHRQMSKIVVFCSRITSISQKLAGKKVRWLEKKRFLPVDSASSRISSPAKKKAQAAENSSSQGEPDLVPVLAGIVQPA